MVIWFTYTSVEGGHTAVPRDQLFANILQLWHLITHTYGGADKYLTPPTRSLPSLRYSWLLLCICVSVTPSVCFQASLRSTTVHLSFSERLSVSLCVWKSVFIFTSVWPFVPPESKMKPHKYADELLTDGLMLIYPILLILNTRHEGLVQSAKWSVVLFTLISENTIARWWRPLLPSYEHILKRD